MEKSPAASVPQSLVATSKSTNDERAEAMLLAAFQKTIRFVLTGALSRRVGVLVPFARGGMPVSSWYLRTSDLHGSSMGMARESRYQLRVSSLEAPGCAVALGDGPRVESMLTAASLYGHGEQYF